MIALVNTFVIAVSLALDAMSVSVAGGIRAKRARLQDGIKIALYFGLFQAGMPLLGWFIGSSFQHHVNTYSHWIAFILLTAIGIKMIKDAFNDTAEKERLNLLNHRTLLLLAVATSIDALVVGVTLSILGLPLIISAVIIGVVTFALSLAGYVFGNRLGQFFEGKVEIIGGIALIIIGLKILVT